MNNYKTPQEELWAGTFGDTYVERNDSIKIISNNIHLFSTILRMAAPRPGSIMEIGANIGMNLSALHTLLPHAELSGIEINKLAYDRLCELEYVKAYHASVFDFSMDYKRDLVFTKGVLIILTPIYCRICIICSMSSAIVTYASASTITQRQPRWNIAGTKTHFSKEILRVS